MNRLVPARTLPAMLVGAMLACLALGCGGHAATTHAEANADAGAASTSSGLTLTVESRRRAGIATRRLGSATTVGDVELAGMLIADPSRITTVQAPIAGRLATVEGGHWPTFGQRIVAGTVLGQVSDAKPLVADRTGTITRVGAQPGQIVQAGQVLLEVTDVGRPLARIVWRSDAPQPAPATIRVRGDVPAGWVIADLVGLAPDADSLTRFPVYFYRVAHGWPGAGPGTPVEATLAAAGNAARGLFVPAVAVVQWEGLAWVYVEHATTAGFAYERTRVDTGHPVADGWLVTPQAGEGHLAPGDAVVVRGAQQLLSEEFKSRATTGDDDQQ